MTQHRFRKAPDHFKIEYDGPGAMSKDFALLSSITCHASRTPRYDRCDNLSRNWHR